uniref:C1q domain-containing protein n=1 Tax=Sphaeramia orbicularis TaxID=375764 RepID=A0A673BDJ4_9TELE
MCLSSFCQHFCVFLYLTGQKGDLGEKGQPGQGMPGMMGMPGPCTPAIKSAFSALLNTSFPIKNWPVSFPNVLYNLQEHFNPNMGIYTAPVNGTYLFSFNLAVKDKPLKVGLFRNFLPVIKTTEGSSISTVSQVIILHLHMLDQVWLQVKDEDNNGMYAGGESTSSFTGVLLTPDSCDYPMNRGHVEQLTPSGTYEWD